MGPGGLNITLTLTLIVNETKEYLIIDIIGYKIWLYKRISLLADSLFPSGKCSVINGYLPCSTKIYN